MKRYKFIGTEKEREDYRFPKPEYNKIYNSNDLIGEDDVESWAKDYFINHEWKRVKKVVKKKANPNEALRYNSGKPKYSILDLDSFESGVRVLEFGANKYARDNWRKGLQFSEVLDSMMRHIAGLQKGEWLDPESGLPHVGHLQCNAMFLGYKGTNMDLEILKQEPCCGNWNSEGECKCDKV